MREGKEKSAVIGPECRAGSSFRRCEILAIVRFGGAKAVPHGGEVVSREIRTAWLPERDRHS